MLSLPSNFTYNPPGAERSHIQRQPSVISQGRRKTLHCPQQIFLSHFDDIKSIDESTSDIYNVRELQRRDSSKRRKEDKNSLLHIQTNFDETQEAYVREMQRRDSSKRRKEDKSNLLHVQTNFDDIITINQHSDLLRVADNNLCPQTDSLKLPQEKMLSDNMLKLPMEQRPLHKLYGSTKHLFRQKSVEINEETPFIQVTETDHSEPITNVELKIHDSQESVQRIISERRKLDENLKDINEFDIFERTDTCEKPNENIVECVVIQGSTVSDVEVVIEEDVC